MCACGDTLAWTGGKVAHLQHHMVACNCPEERAVCKRLATTVRSLTYATIKHDRADDVADAVASFWGVGNNGGIDTAPANECAGDERRLS